MKSMLRNWKLNSLLIILALATPHALFALTGFSATMDSTNLNYSFSYSGAPVHLRVYIDSDKNVSTGYSTSGIGADYLIENSALYRFSGTSGSSWSWASAGSSNMVNVAPNVKWTVPRASLGNPTSLNVVANTSAGDTSSIVTQTLPTTVTWTFCANRGELCRYTGTKTVRYGAGSTYFTKTLPGPITCNNATFGGSPVGGAKHCDIANAAPSPSPSPSPSPRPSPSPSPVASPSPSPSPVASPSPSPVASPSPRPSPSPSAPPSGTTSSVSFTANNSSIRNPERGFFMTTDCRANPQGVTQLQNYKAQGQTVFNCLWYLREFKSSPISSTVLAQLQTQMDNARTAGVKLILRFIYTSADIYDAPLNIVQGHLDQLAPYLRTNVDVIATIQAGIIGQWGEMAASANYGQPSTSTDWANRKAVIDKLLAVVPSSRMVAVRTPQFKMQPYGSTPLNSTEAYTGTPRARVSHYNDCFISSANDWGTYVTSADRPFIQQDSKYLAVSGETCSLSTYNDCTNAVNEMTQHHWSLLHEGYNVDVINKFKAQGCYETIKSRLGYRLQLQNATLSTSARVGGTIRVAFNVANTGFSALYNARPVQLILRNASTGAVIRLPINADPRRWEPGTTTTVDQLINLPSTIPAGTYAMLLALPDAATGLVNRPDYSIQLANTGIWETSTGFNHLNLNLVVSP